MRHIMYFVLDADVLCIDAEVRRLRSGLEMAWQFLFESGSSHYQRCMKLLLTLTHVRQCGVELTQLTQLNRRLRTQVSDTSMSAS